MSAFAAEPTAPAVNDASSATPVKDKYFADLKAFWPGSYTVIRGIEDENDEEDDEEIDDDNIDFTAEQVANFRVICLTEEREKYINAGMKFADPNDGWFNTQTGNDIISSIPWRIYISKKKKTLASQFNSLLGLTLSLHYFDYWMQDNEMWGDGEDGEVDLAVKKLAKAWKNLLSHSDAELEIDSQYTRPGVESLLQDFSSTVDSSESIQVKFLWNDSVTDIEDADENADDEDDGEDDENDDDDDDDDSWDDDYYSRDDDDDEITDYDAATDELMEAAGAKLLAALSPDEAAVERQKVRQDLVDSLGAEPTQELLEKELKKSLIMKQLGLCIDFENQRTY